MAKRDHAAFDAVVLTALKASRYPTLPTYVIRNRMDQAVRPGTCAPVLQSLRRLEAAGLVRQAEPYLPGCSIVWAAAEPAA